MIVCFFGFILFDCKALVSFLVFGFHFFCKHYQGEHWAREAHSSGNKSLSHVCIPLYLYNIFSRHMGGHLLFL